MDCIFCKILKGEIPAHTVYEDEHVYAFLDISQWTRGHTLIIPKKHVRNVYELNDETATVVAKAIPKVARALKEAFDPIGLNIINNNDKPHQTVNHFHVHLLPRYEDDGVVLNGTNQQDNLSDKDYRQIKESIIDALGKKK